MSPAVTFTLASELGNGDDPPFPTLPEASADPF
jgi:hypothetical protein